VRSETGAENHEAGEGGGGRKGRALSRRRQKGRRGGVSFSGSESELGEDDVSKWYLSPTSGVIDGAVGRGKIRAQGEGKYYHSLGGGRGDEKNTARTCSYPSVGQGLGSPLFRFSRRGGGVKSWSLWGVVSWDLVSCTGRGKREKKPEKTTFGRAKKTGRGCNLNGGGCLLTRKGREKEEITYPSETKGRTGGLFLYRRDKLGGEGGGDWGPRGRKLVVILSLGKGEKSFGGPWGWGSRLKVRSILHCWIELEGGGGHRWTTYSKRPSTGGEKTYL